jgi:hypothetical protein
MFMDRSYDNRQLALRKAMDDARAAAAPRYVHLNVGVYWVTAGPPNPAYTKPDVVDVVHPEGFYERYADFLYRQKRGGAVT